MSVSPITTDMFYELNCVIYLMEFVLLSLRFFLYCFVNMFIFLSSVIFVLAFSVSLNFGMQPYFTRMLLVSNDNYLCHGISHSMDFFNCLWNLYTESFGCVLICNLIWGNIVNHMFSRWKSTLNKPSINANKPGSVFCVFFLL